MNTLTIDTITIRKDSEGRYCLNDIHKAAGGERRHEPLNWRNTDGFKEIAAELGVPVLGKMPIDPAIAEAVEEEQFYEMENPYLKDVEL